MGNVTDVTRDGEIVVVAFDDSHEMQFVPFREQKRGVVTDLQLVVMKHAGIPVFELVARTPGDPAKRHRIRFIAPGYTPQDVARRWRQARIWLIERCGIEPVAMRRVAEEPIRYAREIVVGFGDAHLSALEKNATRIS
jgi:hypothetical protein